MQSNSISIKGMAPYLQVYDMPASLQFYRDKLGFELMEQSQPDKGDDCGWALLSKDGKWLTTNQFFTPYLQIHNKVL